MAPAFLWLLESTEDEWTYNASGNVPAFILQLFVYLLASIFILRHWRGFVAGISDSKWAIMLVGLAIVSALWAWDPLFTFRKGLVLAATTAFGIYFGTRFTRDHQVALLCTAVSMIAILSVLIVVFIPHYGIDDGSESGGWRGVFLTKNVLGRASILGAIAFYCYPRKLVGGNFVRFLGLAAFCALVVFSKSSTAVMVGTLLSMLALIYSLTYYSLGSRYLVPVILQAMLGMSILVIIVIGYGAELLHFLLVFLGRDVTLTGRIPLWDAVLQAIIRKPLLGYGFMSFWSTPEGFSVVEEIQWRTPHAHNGFLELWLALGALGVLIFGIGLVTRVRTAMLEYLRAESRTAVWPLLFLSFFVLYNLTENSFLNINSIYWMLFTASLIREENCGWLPNQSLGK